MFRFNREIAFFKQLFPKYIAVKLPCQESISKRCQHFDSTGFSAKSSFQIIIGMKSIFLAFAADVVPNLVDKLLFNPKKFIKFFKFSAFGTEIRKTVIRQSIDGAATIQAFFGIQVVKLNSLFLS